MSRQNQGKETLEERERKRLSDSILSLEMKERHNAQDRIDLSILKSQLRILFPSATTKPPRQYITTLPLRTADGLLCQFTANGKTTQFTNIKQMIAAGISSYKGATA